MEVCFHGKFISSVGEERHRRRDFIIPIKKKKKTGNTVERFPSPKDSANHEQGKEERHVKYSVYTINSTYSKFVTVRKEIKVEVASDDEPRSLEN